jgi:hypothetical protein
MIGIVIALAVAIGCGPSTVQVDDATPPPWKVGASTVAITAAPDAGGPLSFRNCPTLDAAAVAVPLLVSGPEANAVPFKTMVLQCGYQLAELDVQLRPAGIGILVFDASIEGTRMWDPVIGDPARPDVTDVPGLGDRTFATGSPGHQDLYVVAGSYGLHLSHTRQGPIPLEQMVALAREMLDALKRPPR